MMLNAEYDGRPEEYDQLRQCWLNERRLLFLEEQIGKSGRAGSLRVLEIGSGTGWLLAQLAAQFPSSEFTGIEPERSYVEFSKKRGLANLHFVLGTAEECGQVLKGPFDIILSNDVLHHVASLEATVRNMTSLARKGTRWIAIEPNCLNPYTAARQASKAGERNFYPWQLQRHVQRAAWRTNRKRYLFIIPPFIKVAPDWAIALERRLEWAAPLTGGVVLDLVKE